MPPQSPGTLDAGRLDRRVSLQSWTQSSDQSGQPRGAWSDWAEVWAEVIELPGQETVVGQQVVATPRYLVTIRWRPGVTARTRLRYEGRLLNVTAPPRRLGRRVALELDCSELEGAAT